MGFAPRTLAAPLALALCLVLTAASPPPAPTGLTQVALASGHAARVHLRAMVQRTRDNRTSIETLDVQGVRRLRRRCIEDLCSGSFFDGTTLHNFGINSTPFPEATGEEATLRTYAAVVSTAFAESDFTGTVTPLAASTLGDRYRVSAPEGAPLIVLINPQTHALAAVARADGTPIGRLSAHRVGDTVLYDEGTFDSVTRVEGAIAAPTGPTTVSPGASTVDLGSEPLPIVPCSIEGRRAMCLIDTGTSPSGMSLAFAEKLGREPHGEISMTALGEYLTGAIEAGPVTIGTTSIGPMHFAVEHETRGLNFDILIGADALASVHVTLDRVHRTLTIGPSAPSQSAEHTIALSFARGVPYVDAQLGGTASRLLFDTGDNGTLSISYESYRRDTTLFVARANVRAYGLGGAMDALSGELPAATIGPVILRNVPIRAIRGQYEGHLGYGFAEHCERLGIDFARKQLDCAKI